MKILLIRHGQSTGNVEARFTGQTDVPLTELGITQGKILCKHLVENYNIDAIYTSQLSRAKDTVKNLVQQLKITPTEDKRINELYLGDWEGKLISDLKATCPNDLDRWSAEPKTFHCPKGESFNDVYTRTVEFLLELVEKDHKTVCVCAHGGVVRSALCFAKYGSVDHVNKVDWGMNASITEIDYENGKFTIVKEFYDDYLNQLKSGYVGVL